MTKCTACILIIKPTRCTNFAKFIFGIKLYVSGISSVHHQEFFTVHTAMVYVIQVCRQLAPRKVSEKLYDIYHCCVYSEKLVMMDRGTVRNMQSFILKINLAKLVHLVCFIIRIYHDAR